MHQTKSGCSVKHTKTAMLLLWGHLLSLILFEGCVLLLTSCKITSHRSETMSVLYVILNFPTSNFSFYRKNWFHAILSQINMHSVTFPQCETLHTFSLPVSYSSTNLPENLGLWSSWHVNPSKMKTPWSWIKITGYNITLWSQFLWLINNWYCTYTSWLQYSAHQEL